MQEFDCTYPTLVPGRYQAMGSYGTPLWGGGAQSEVPGTTRAGLGVPGPSWRPELFGSVLRLLDTQVPLDATEELRTEWGPVAWI